MGEMAASSRKSVASKEAALVENAVSKLYYLQCITIEMSSFLIVHFQL